MAYIRSGGRAADQLRPVRITRGFTIHAEGSVLIEFGNTRVLCTASVEEKVPPHKRGSGEGWVTAEYGIAPPGPAMPDGGVPIRLIGRRSEAIACPRCGSLHTEKLAAFGSTACKSMYRCLACREPFEHFKPI